MNFKLIIKLFVVIFLLFTSCKTIDENINDYDFNILLNDTLNNNDNKQNNKNIDKDILIEKNKLLLASSPSKQVLKSKSNNETKIIIKEINNTKVIKRDNNYSEGRIVYKIPEKMRVRSNYKVLVRISKSKSTVSIYDTLSGNVITSKIPVTETMEVKLIDVSPKDKQMFHIVDGNSSVQIIESGDTYTEWSWNVTPNYVGKSNLKIVVSIIRNDNKKDIVYEDTVEVETDIVAQISFFIHKYWQVLMTSIVLPFLVWIYKRRSNKNKKEDKNEKENED